MYWLSASKKRTPGSCGSPVVSLVLLLEGKPNQQQNKERENAQAHSSSSHDSLPPAGWIHGCDRGDDLHKRA